MIITDKNGIEYDFAPELADSAQSLIDLLGHFHKYGPDNLSKVLFMLGAKAIQQERWLDLAHTPRNRELRQRVRILIATLQRNIEDKLNFDALSVK